MKQDDVRFMWLLCFFDLPVGSPGERKAANKFRIHLKKDGFIMLQLSVYARICKGQDGVEKHKRRISGALPKKGYVRLLQVTHQQYARMDLMLGNVRVSEEKAPEQLVLL